MMNRSEDVSASNYRIDLDRAPNPADTDIIRQGLDTFNQAIVGATNWQPLAVFVRDPANEIVGGLTGGTYWGWLYVETFWLHEDLRGHGCGQLLLALAEREAIARGCRNAHLDTMDFQALPFYQKQGYSVYGVLDDMPSGTGHQRFFLRKALQSVAD